MDLSTVTTPEGKVIAINVDENLDLSVHSLFVQACELAADRGPGCIEVNVANTRTVRDSGLAMLMMLRRCAGRLGDRIKLVNCSPELRSQLLAGSLGADISLK